MQKQKEKTDISLKIRAEHMFVKGVRHLRSLRVNTDLLKD